MTDVYSDDRWLRAPLHDMLTKAADVAVRCPFVESLRQILSFPQLRSGISEAVEDDLQAFMLQATNRSEDLQEPRAVRDRDLWNRGRRGGVRLSLHAAAQVQAAIYRVIWLLDLLGELRGRAAASITVTPDNVTAKLYRCPKTLKKRSDDM